MRSHENMRRTFNYANACVDINNTQTTSDEIRDVMTGEKGITGFTLYDRCENTVYPCGEVHIEKLPHGDIFIQLRCKPSDIEPATMELHLRLKDIV